jgi:adenylate kinase
MVKDRLTHDDVANGFLLDGFPRNVAQAEVLRAILAEKKTPLHAVLEFSLANEEIVARLSSRRTCKECGQPSVGQEKCPQCGGDVYQREDDKAEVIARRLEVYQEQTAPIISFYRNEGLLITVGALGSVEDITAHAISALSRVSE